MRHRITGLVALGTGVFLTVLAILLRFYAAPTLEVLPKDYWSHYLATGTGSAFDARSASVANNLALTQDITIKGQTSPTRAPSNSVVWDYASELSFATSTPCSDKPPFNHNQCPLSISNETVAFDDVTGISKDWSGDKVDNDLTRGGATQKHTGYISKFPFHLEKKSYPLWDSFTGTSPNADYVGTEKVSGLTTYKFVQKIGVDKPVHVYDRTDVPPVLVGDLGDVGKSIPVWYTTTVTAWVDPISGIPVKGTQSVHIALGSIDGTDPNRLPILDGTLSLDKIQVTDSADKPKFNADGTPVWTDYVTQSARDAKAADRVQLLRNTLPLIFLILGLLLLVFGVFVTVRAESGGTRPAAEAEGETTAGKPASAESADHE